MEKFIQVGVKLWHFNMIVIYVCNYNRSVFVYDIPYVFNCKFLIVSALRK
jgi:hypothetical protein